MAKPNRKVIDSNISKRLSHLQKDKLLPMEHKVDYNTKVIKKITCEEWAEYSIRSKLYRSYNKDYDSQFNRPSLEKAEAIWNLLSLNSLIKFKNFLTKLYGWLNEEEEKELMISRKQGVSIVLDILIAAGQSQRTISCNRIFEALCSGFSDHYILSNAKLVRDMSRKTVFNCRRDLLLNGINIKNLWDLVGKWSKETESFKLTEQSLKNLKGESVSDEILKKLENLKSVTSVEKGSFLKSLKSTIGEEQYKKHKSSVLKHSQKTDIKQENPLFSIELPTFDGKSQPIIVKLNDSTALKKFLSIMKNDKQYNRADFPCIKALFNRPKKEKEEERFLNRKVCADIPYKVVKLGKKSKELLSHIEDVSLIFDVTAFKNDYEKAKKKKKIYLEKLKINMI